MKSIKVGDRVKYVGGYLENICGEKDPQQDLVPGYEGVVVDVHTQSYVALSVRVRFDKHWFHLAPWRVSLDEIELVSETKPLEVKCTNYHPDYGLTDEFRARVLAYADLTSVKIAAQEFNLDKSTIYYWRRATRNFI